MLLQAGLLLSNPDEMTRSVFAVEKLCSKLFDSIRRRHRS